MSCVYEVTVTLPAAAREKTLAYMRDKHILDVLKDPAFIKAQFFHCTVDDGSFQFTTHFYASSEELLKQYSSGYANEMKADFMKHFGKYNPEVSRRVLTVDDPPYFLRDDKSKTLFSGKYLEFNYREGWECIDRLTASDVVAIVAVNEKEELILVEQYRPAVRKCVIELPAGLVNDGRYKEVETVESAAQKELLEETGYWAESFETLLVGPTSAGCLSEVVTFVRAGTLEKRGEGGGVDSEDIEVHTIPLSNIQKRLQEIAKQDKLIDPKIYTALSLLRSV